jgi:hypothetical protein
LTASSIGEKIWTGVYVEVHSYGNTLARDLLYDDLNEVIVTGQNNFAVRNTLLPLNCFRQNGVVGNDKYVLSQA